jgi:hypothetical protein
MEVFSIVDIVILMIYNMLYGKPTS